MESEPETQPESDHSAGEDYDARMSDLLVRLIRLGSLTQIAIIVGAFVMGGALLLHTRANGNAIATTNRAIDELRRDMVAHRCHCDLRNVRAEATNNVTVVPDRNSTGQLAREILIEQGKLHDVRGTTAATRPDQRAD